MEVSNQPYQQERCVTLCLQQHSLSEQSRFSNYLEIIPYLDSLPGTAYIRDENGKLVLDEGWENPEE